jgi:EmrB/QacA subfamily drug resistance transporter
MTSHRYLIALVTALGLIPVVLDTTIVVVALPSISHELHTDLTTVQWIVTAFFLANAATIVAGGYLANRFGRKRIFLLGVTAFTLGSALCAISPNIEWLIAFRVFQGIGGGILIPVGPALAFDAFPQAERAKASAIVGVPLLLAPVLGPIIGGYLNDMFLWHSIFFVNLPIGIIAIVAAFAVLPIEQTDEAPRIAFDIAGLILSSVGIVAIVYAFHLVTETNPDTITPTNPNGDLYGWSYRGVWVFIAIGIAALAMFTFYSLFLSRDPALDLRQFRRRDFTVSSLIMGIGNIVSFGLLFILPIYFESVRQPNLSAFNTGIALVPFGLGTILGTLLSAALFRVVGPRWIGFIATALAALSAWILSQIIHSTVNASQLIMAMQTQTSVPAVAGPEEMRLGMFFVGMSLAMLGIVTQTLALEMLKGKELDKATSLFLSIKGIFASIGVAIISTIFVDTTRSRATDFINEVSSIGQSSGGNSSAAAVAIMPSQIASQSGTWAIQHIFWLIFFGSLGLMLLTVLLPGRKR